MQKNKNIDDEMIAEEQTSEPTDKYFGIPFGNHSYYLAHVPTGRSQHENEVEISKEEYETLLKANQESGAEIRLCGQGKLKAFIDHAESDKHVWNNVIESFEISDEDLQALKLDQNTTFLSFETRRVSDAIAILDDAIEFGVATDDEIHKHTELRKYRLLLSRVPNQENWPLDPIWPVCPEFFRSKE